MYCSPLYTGSFAALASHNEVINSHSLNGANATENKTLLRALAYPGGTGVDGRFRRIHREQKPQARRSKRAAASKPAAVCRCRYMYVVVNTAIAEVEG